MHVIVSSSGDKLLPAYSDEGARRADIEYVGSYVLPEMGDVEAFPSLSKAATTISANRTPALVPTRKQNAHERALNNRILFMNNVGQGPEVNQKAFRLFFSGYTVIDVKRPLNPISRTPNPTAFVMLASAQERDDALYTLKNISMQGRRITLEAPKTFHNGEWAFVLHSNALHRQPLLWYAATWTVLLTYGKSMSMASCPRLMKMLFPFLLYGLTLLLPSFRHLRQICPPTNAFSARLKLLLGSYTYPSLAKSVTLTSLLCRDSLVEGTMNCNSGRLHRVPDQISNTRLLITLNANAR